jgi:hypothetical protein
MSYSSETEVSSDDEKYSFKTSKREDQYSGFKQEQYVHPSMQTMGAVPNGQIFSAIVLENEDIEVEQYNPQSTSPTTPRRYFTRSKSTVKDEPQNGFPRKFTGAKRPAEYDDEEEIDEDITSEEDYSDQDDVFIAQQVKAGQKKEKKARNNKKEFKRARRSALPWTTAESKTLSLLVNLYGAKEWQFVAKILQSKHNNNRTAAQCSQRWCRVINPVINKGAWDLREDKLLCEKYDDLQGSWCKIVKFFPDRTDTQCKRRYEKILQMRNR